MNEIRFTYKPKITKYILRIIFFGVCAFGFGVMAQSNGSGVVANEFSVNGESILFWSLAIASAIIMVFLHLRVICHNRFQKPHF